MNHFLNKNIFLNIASNTLITVIFVFLSNQSLDAGLEETLVALAMIYGAIMVISNALFIYLLLKRE